MKLIVIRPIITEKAMEEVGKGKFTFEVEQDVNKHEIAKYIHEAFKVDAQKVNICHIKSEMKNVRNRKIATRKWKKAIVTLKKGQKIEGFEVKK